EALRTLEKGKFDAVLLDEEMPQMSGAETVRRIREQEKATGGHQVVIAVSGNTTEEDHQRLRAAGMDECLSKPLRASELSRKLRTAVQSPSRQAKEIRPAPDGSTTTARNTDLLERVGGDANLLAKMIRTFRTDSPKKLADMKRAIRRKNGIA